MSVLQDIADVIRAATDLVREVRPKAHEPALKREHFIVTVTSGSLKAPNVPVTGPHCMYCGKLQAEIVPGEACGFFT